jgi:GntR family transcriptional regulator
MSRMDITVDLASPTPPYDQICAQIAAAIDSGQLDEGTHLPV